MSRITEAERILLDYQTIERILARAERLREEKGGLPLGAEMVIGESDIHLRARMYEIRRMIFSIPDEDAKLFLYYRYVYGETMEGCADMLSVSRATVYRIRRRALQLFSELVTAERCDA
jgi:DNA-directed RNA polymerase specialized sigma24 family protein